MINKKNNLLIFKLYIVTISVFFVTCPQISSESENLDARIYMAGYYLDGNTRKACYWSKGLQINLDIPEVKDSLARAIAVSDNIVYVAGGYYYGEDPDYTACYWINGKRIVLEIPERGISGYANAIAISKSKVYVAGYYYFNTYDKKDRIACYWIDGERIDMTESGSAAYSITIQDDIVYMAGEYMPDSDIKPCYWVDGEKKDIDSIENYNTRATGIALSDGNVYVSGTDGNKACYWINGVRTDISIADAHSLYISSIAIENGNVFMAGKYYNHTIQKEKGFYSVNKTVKYLAPNTANYFYIDDLTVLNGKVYIVGHYYIGAWATGNAGFSGYHSACYWLNGVNNDISSKIGILAITAGI
jgi:hypothetical protein